MLHYGEKTGEERGLGGWGLSLSISSPFLSFFLSFVLPHYNKHQL